MALVGNRSVLNKSPGRFLNRGVAILRSEFGKHGMMRNVYERFDDKSAFPNGHLSPSAWVLPKARGGMSSINSSGLEVQSSGLAVGGITTAAATTLSVGTNSPVGNLIAFGIGSVGISVSPNNPLLTASLNGNGGGSFGVSTNVPILGARASLVGETMLTFSCALTPYAVGRMNGTTEEQGLTLAGITNSVMNAPLANYKIPGSAGSALAAASSGGVDYGALGLAVWTSASRTLTSEGVSPSVEDIAAAVRASIETELARLNKLAALSAIDATLVVTPTTRSAGGVTQTITTVGDTTTVS